MTQKIIIQREEVERIMTEWVDAHQTFGKLRFKEWIDSNNPQGMVFEVEKPKDKFA